ncbi:glutamine--fructose-6-phosphate aminotransferase [isomerizing] [bacterium BMS3Abin07]|nr:glutamine--fructose-6-phosphate aminotransferase [isomerizing] [bacterium BMS3Abin07]GBE33064.1 glutamine--fructose-6-phosphate aminotransferase [isomerizing] [bacterium BMS3Bbin05]HDO21836.1 glutamine--fructose-6-phosphate transaminase (isomerizing) [Nitrospirota bacterium]
MCGIVGYIGKSGSLQTLVDGLKRLEYRGYDSAGVVYQNGNGMELYKTKGKLKELQSILPNPVPVVKVGLGHTRWATHGIPSSINAHPHSIDGIAVVHNGIIENYRELKSCLIEEGHEFVSETDSEVVPQLISSYIRKGLSFREAIKAAIARLRGSYALGILSKSNPEMLFAVRKGSPLVVGLGEGDFYFASDIPAILPYTNRFIFMEDGHLCTLTEDGVEICNVDSGITIPVDQKTVEVDWVPAMAEKNGFDHFMLKEIHEQPHAIMDTIGELIENPRGLLENLGISTKTIIDLRKIQIVACGTSYHAAMIGRYIIENLAHIPVDIDIASEYRHRDPIVENGTLFISITQSGETADTLAAQRVAKEKGAWTLTICNVVGSTSTREAHSVLYTRAGPEIGVASTKAFTSQVADVCVLALALGLRRGRLSFREADTFKNLLLKIPGLVEKTLKNESKIKDMARSLIYSHGFLFLGRGLSYPVALEGALKLKEISYMHAEGYPAGEMKHGPIALIEEGLPVVVVVPVDELYEKTLSNIEEVKARGGKVIAVTDEPGCLHGKVDEIIEVPSTHSSLSPFLTVIPLQLLAYYVGVLRGCDVDQPRNLAKSVTVE